MEAGDTVGAAALGVLALVFLGSLIALAVICYRRHVLSKLPHQIFNNTFSKPELMLIDDAAAAVGGLSGEACAGLELEDVRVAPQIDKILNDAQWVDDATGLIPHCLAILKLCHLLTERLVASTLTPLPQYQLDQIIQASRRVSPRLDDVARAMYPPLDPRLLEARCSALTLTLALLAAHTQPPQAPSSSSSCTPSLASRDIASALQEMDAHMQVLREAAQSYDNFQQLLSDSVTRDAVDC